MRILRLVYDFPPPWQGLAPFPYELTKAEAKRGHIITVICGHWPNQTPPLPKRSKKITLHRIIREPMRGTMLLTTAIFGGIYAFMLTLFRTYDVVYGHGHFPLWYLLFRSLTPFLTHPRYVQFLHVTAAGRREQAKQSGDAPNVTERLVEWPLHTMADRLGCRAASLVCVTGDQIKQEAIEHYLVPEEKILVVGNGVDTHTFTPEGPSKRVSLGYTEKDFVLLFVGVHSERKGILLLIEALATLPPSVKLLTIGTGEETFTTHLENRVAQLGLKDRVQLLGYKPYPLASYFRAANLLVLPSSYEGFPKVVLESLACGVPVLASGFKINAPLPGITFLKKVSPRQLSDEINAAIQKPQWIDNDMIKNEYSWDALCKKLESTL